MATWTTMNDLSTGDLVTESDMDTLRGNIEYLLDPNKDDALATGAYSTTSTSFVDVSTSDVVITITTNGGPLLIEFGITVSTGALPYVYVDIDVDGTRLGNATYGLAGTRLSINAGYSRIEYLSGIAFAAVEAGSHTIKLQWLTSTGDSISTGGALGPIRLNAVEI